MVELHAELLHDQSKHPLYHLDPLYLLIMLMLNLKRENVKNTVNFGIIYYLIIKYMKTKIIAKYVKISCKFS